MTSDRQQYRVELDTSLGSEPATDVRGIGREVPDKTFRIVLVGDFSGRANRGVMESGRALAARRPSRVDRDDIDATIAALAPELRLPMTAETRVSVRFGELDDFHPDRLYARLPRFRQLRETREIAAAPALPRDAGRQAARASGGRAAGGSVLDQILGDLPAPPGGAAAAAARPEPMRATDPDGLTEFVRRAVAPHVVPDTRPANAERVAEIDATAAAELRTVLHHPDFQALESTWRTVDFLARRLETDSSLQLHLADVSKAELALDAAAATPAGGPWALLVGLFSFGPEDVELLGQLAAVARAAGAPFVAGADSRLVGCASFGSAPDPDDWATADLPGWDSLRRSEAARYLGLTMPRFLLRLPYGGRDGDPCDVPAFEELPGPDAHEEYLWGSAGALCALLFGEAFAAGESPPRPRLEVRGLPLHLIRAGGDVAAKPCAEAVLSARAVERIVDRGLMAVQSEKEGDAVRLYRMQSVADPLAPLAVQVTSS